MEDFIERIDGKPGRGRSGTVNNWETGKNAPNKKRLKRIAELGGVSINYLMHGYDADKDAVLNGLFDAISVNYFMPDAGGTKYGLETYDIQQTVDDYFNSKGLETPLDKFYDEEHDEPASFDTPGASEYLIDNLPILKSDDFIRKLIGSGGLYTNKDGKLSNRVNDEAAIALLCTELEAEMAKHREANLSSLENDWYDLTFKYRHSVAVLLSQSKSDALKQIDSFISELKIFSKRIK